MKNMDEEEKFDVVNEIRLQSAMHHPNIVLLRESYTTKKGMKNIVMELADGDDFDSLIHDRQMTSRCQDKPLKYFKEADIFNWFTQILLALKYIHDRKVLHRDIKTDNIMKCKNGVVKLSDFGVSKRLNETCGLA